MRAAKSMDIADGTSAESRQVYCQRCLNHGLIFARKSHKPFCKYMSCTCAACSMVEDRRQLNNAIARQTSQPQGAYGQRNRSPMCTRCSSHGVETPLRGHKKSKCPFEVCKCDACELITKRRQVMAAQIKLRRHQHRILESSITTSSSLLGSSDDERASNYTFPLNFSALAPSSLIAAQSVYSFPVIQPIMRPRMTAALDLVLASMLGNSQPSAPSLNYDQFQLVLSLSQQSSFI